jgi:hypothetical protein
MLISDWIGYDLAYSIIFIEIKNVSRISISDRSDWRSSLHLGKLWIILRLGYFPACPISVADAMKLIVFLVVNIPSPFRISQSAKTISSSKRYIIWLSEFPMGLI